VKEVVGAGLVSFFAKTVTVTVTKRGMESSETFTDNDIDDNQTGLQKVVRRIPSSCIMEMALSPFDC
jgi:hypothetical protein